MSDHHRSLDRALERQDPLPTADKDAPKGCPVTVWDGPYSFRCGLGASVGRCAYHGPFDPSLIRVTSPGEGNAP